MSLKWYQKATVQSAIIGGVFVLLAGILTTCISIYFSGDRKEENSTLKEQNPAIINQKIISNLNNFNVINKSTIIDLRTSKHIPDNKLNEKYSFVNLYHNILLNANGSGNKELRLPYKSGGTGLDVICMTHKYTVFTSIKEEQSLAGNFKIERLIEIDLSNLQDGRDLLVSNTATYWNSFEKFPRYGLVSNLQDTPQVMELTVIFPSNITFPKYKVYKLLKTDRIESRDHKVYENLDDNTLHIRVQVEETNVNRTYLLEWDWIP